MSGAMDFLWSLTGQGFASWNTTYRMEQFYLHVPGFDSLTLDMMQQVVTNLDTEDLEDLSLVWSLRETILPGFSSTDFIDMFILDPNATDTLLPYYLPTTQELCALFKPQLVFQQSIIGLIPSTIILLILIFFKPRKTLWKDTLWGRPSLLVPINFIDEHGRRWAYCGAFAVMTNFLIDFFDQQYFWNPGHWNDADWSLRFSWIKPFILLGNVIHLGYLFYPLFACLSLRRLIPANILGLAYVAFWMYSHISEISNCPIKPEEGTTQLSTDEAFRLVTFIPVFLGEAAVLFAFILDLVINSYRCHLKLRNQEHKYKRKSRWGGKETIPLMYIEYLMTSHQEKPKTLKEKIKRMFVYTNVKGFKYPPRVICTICVAFVLLLSVTIYFGKVVDSILIPLEQATGLAVTLEPLLGEIANISEPTLVKVMQQAPRYVSGIRGCTILANVLASLLHFGSMIHMMGTYRRHIRMVMRGDRSWYHENNSSPATKLIFGMRYSGYQIAYLLWGYVITFILMAIVSVAVSVLIIIPITFGETPFFFSQIIILLSTAVGSMIINFTQIPIVKFGFLEENGAHLAITNRRAYHMVSYFIFFFNIVLGAFSVIKRSLLSLLFGTLLLCRLDRCLLMRGFERFDAGFTAYISMLEVDVTHNHPVLKGFIYILKAEVKDTKERQQGKCSNDDAEKGVELNRKPRRRIDKRIRNKWWKLITLVNNPVLVIERLQKKVQEEREKKPDERIPRNKVCPEKKDNVVEMIAATREVFKVDDLGDTSLCSTDIVPKPV